MNSDGEWSALPDIPISADLRIEREEGVVLDHGTDHSAPAYAIVDSRALAACRESRRVC